MVKYQKISETDEAVQYRYFPEGNDEFGIVLFNKVTGNFSVEEKTAQKYRPCYVGHMIHEIKAFSKTGIFRETGIVAWY